MTQLSRNAILGLAKETTPGTYLAPTTFVPFEKCDFEDMFAEIKDSSYRANDSVVQGLYQGPVSADWSIDLLAYPDVIGPFLRGIIGPDTVTAGVSTTTSASSIAGATSISTALTVAPLTYIQIDSGANLEYAQVTAVSGAGPFVLTVTTVAGQAVGLTLPHASAVPVVAAYTHTFKQNGLVAKPTYSVSVFDTLTTLGYSWGAFTDLQIKIDPKAAVSLAGKLKTFPGQPQSVLTPVYTKLAPLIGWQWTMTNGGGSSTRGLQYDVTIKRPADPIHSSDGTIGPREIFQGALEVDGTYKAVFENQTDLALYLNYTQSPTTAFLQQPIGAGGASLALTMSKSGYVKGKREWADYVEASFSLTGIYNASDSGSVSAVLTNFVSTAF